MTRHPEQHRLLNLGVVLRRAPGVTRWRKFAWTASAVLPGAGPADWKELRRDQTERGEIVDYHAATVPLELHGAETEAYLHELHARVPSIYVVLRETADDARPYHVVTVTASPYEGQDYTDSGEEVVEKVPMSDGVLAWVWEFVEAFHEDEVFIKRKRGKHNLDLVEDGIGDVRIAQAADVYRAPSVARKERLQ